MFISLFFIILGFILLIVGANVLVNGASEIASKMHIPELIVGLTIVSIGTSMPELFVSITSAINGYSDMAIGNAIGSNLSNLLLILGVAALISPVMFQKETLFFEIPISLIVTIILIIFCNTNNELKTKEGIILLILFIFFLIYTIYRALKGKHKNKQLNNDNSSSSILKNIIFVILGIVGLKMGGDFTVNNAEKIAQSFGLSEKVIAITILSLGTSLPELVTTVMAGIKNKSDIAVGNIIGSNIFNFLLVIGATSLVIPLNYNLSYNFDFTVLICANLMLILFLFIKPKNKINKLKGVIYLLIYSLYLINGLK